MASKAATTRNQPDKARLIANAIERDVMGWPELRQALNRMSPDERDEMRDAWVDIVRQHIGK